MKNFFSQHFFEDKNYAKFLYALCFIAGCLYCLIMTHGTTLSHNILTIFFIFFLTFLLFLNLQTIKRNNDFSHTCIIIQLILLNLGIAITAQIAKSPVTYFWVDDSLKTHLKEALKFTHFFQGNKPASDMGIYSGFSTHSLTGLFLAVLGVNTFSTILAQLVFKTLAAFFVFKIALFFWDKATALLAMMLYGLCPTVFFYNLVFYKESAIQAFYAALIFFSLKLFIERKPIYILPFLISFAGLLRERFYISYLFLITVAFLVYSLPLKKSLTLSFVTLGSAFLGLFLFYKSQSIQINSLPETLIHYRSLHANFGDVLNQYNYDLPYPFAFVKILFSPYFSPNKFKIFTDFSTLLTWGSFVNQAIILSAVLGFIKLVRQRLLHLSLWIPFIIFLLFAAYISPWSGRLRDSFYPLIACYSAFFLYRNKYFRRLFRLNE